MKNQRGFTLMEMLIVVAIIAIMIAIAVPSFTSSLKKSRQSKDEANLRTAYEEGVSWMMLEQPTVHSGIYVAKVNLSAKYTQFRLFGELHYSDKSPTYMPKSKVTYIGGVPYLNKSGINGKTYIIVRVLPDGSVGYEGLAQASHHPDSYYDKIYNK